MKTQLLSLRKFICAMLLCSAGLLVSCRTEPQTNTTKEPTRTDRPVLEHPSAVADAQPDVDLSQPGPSSDSHSNFEESWTIYEARLRDDLTWRIVVTEFQRDRFLWTSDLTQELKVDGLESLSQVDLQEALGLIATTTEPMAETSRFYERGREFFSYGGRRNSCKVPEESFAEELLMNIIDEISVDSLEGKRFSTMDLDAFKRRGVDLIEAEVTETILFEKVGDYLPTESLFRGCFQFSRAFGQTREPIFTPSTALVNSSKVVLLKSLIARESRFRRVIHPTVHGNLEDLRRFPGSFAFHVYLESGERLVARAQLFPFLNGPISGIPAGQSYRFQLYGHTRLRSGQVISIPLSNPVYQFMPRHPLTKGEINLRLSREDDNDPLPYIHLEIPAELSPKDFEIFGVVNEQSPYYVFLRDLPPRVVPVPHQPNAYLVMGYHAMKRIELIYQGRDQFIDENGEILGKGDVFRTIFLDP